MNFWSRYLAFSTIPVALFALDISETFASDCYESSITSPTPFMGNDGEIFKLADGSVWEVKYEHEYMYEYSPDVIVCPARGQMIIDDTKLDVRRLDRTAAAPTARASAPRDLSGLIESQIDGDFEGWEGETIVKLMNGQIWQQSDYHYEYSYAFMPDVIIFRSAGTWKMKVEDTDEAVSVTRLK